MQEYRLVCVNPWCKGHFIYNEFDIQIIDGSEIHPEQCRKCSSFSNELSSGVEWHDKEYEGSRYDGPHEIKYKITNFK